MHTIHDLNLSNWGYYEGSTIRMYRVAQHVSDLGWVDIDFGCSTACLILLGLVRDGQNWQISWAR